jgi:aerobic-type carbon monoxide dehydrogenase small subunit (CoxS/CutS family)
LAWSVDRRPRQSTASGLDENKEERLNLNLTVNGVWQTFEAQPHETLLTVLRREGFTGAKRVCESGECGACAVIVDGRAVDSCIMLAAQAMDREVTTVEGLASPEKLSRLQDAFVENGSIQCGFCIPGMIVAAANYLEENPTPTEDEVRHLFVGNLCRCTGYVKPVEAVMAATAE